MVPVTSVDEQWSVISLKSELAFKPFSAALFLVNELLASSFFPCGRGNNNSVINLLTTRKELYVIIQWELQVTGALQALNFGFVPLALGVCATWAAEPLKFCYLCTVDVQTFPQTPQTSDVQIYIEYVHC